MGGVSIPYTMDPLITVISWSEFLADPPLMYNLFSPTPGRILYESSRVNVLLDQPPNADGTQKGGRVLKANTVEELSQIRQQLLTKPILMRTYAEYVKTEDYGVYRVRTRWRGDFAVLINTLHPLIQEQMTSKFDEAMTQVSQGNKYCLEFDLGPSLERWYAEILNQDTGCSRSSTNSKNTRFYITNHTKYMHCFDCNAIWCVLCSLCWFASAPCYMIHRSLTVKDVQHDIRSPIVMRTPLASGHIAEITPDTDRRMMEATAQILSQANVHQGTGMQAQPIVQQPVQPPPYTEVVASTPPVTSQPNAPLLQPPVAGQPPEQK